LRSRQDEDQHALAHPRRSPAPAERV